MKKSISLFKNMKKWQAGGIIGCAVGVVIATLIVLPTIGFYPLHIWLYTLWEWLQRLHTIPLTICLFTALSTLVPDFMFYIGLVLFIVVPYGGYGAIVGRVQQVDNPRKSRLLTGLLIILLLFIYWININIL